MRGAEHQCRTAPWEKKEESLLVEPPLWQNILEDTCQGLEDTSQGMTIPNKEEEGESGSLPSGSHPGV